jgi:predicted RNA binding protein YcfA (HicA-like mRNA interferase family)
VERVVRAMGKIGFVPVRQSGSHLVLRDKEGNRITIPRHDAIGRGLLIEIIAEAGITKEDFLKLL